MFIYHDMLTLKLLSVIDNDIDFDKAVVNFISTLLFGWKVYNMFLKFRAF